MFGLKGKISIAFLTVVLLACTTIVTFSYLKSSSELTTAVDKGNLHLAHATASEIANVNEREFKMLEGLANLTPIKDPTVDLHDKWLLINSATGKSPQYLGMAIYNEKGIGWTTTEKYSDLHDREYLAKSITGVPAIMDPNWSPVNGNLSTFYALPVRDAQGKQIAEVVSVLDSTELCRTVEKIIVGNNSHPFVINRLTGKFVAHADEDIVKEGKTISDDASPSFAALITDICSGVEGTATYTDESDGIKYSVAYRPIDDCDWVVVCKAPYSDFYGGIGSVLRTMILIAAIALVLAIIIGALAIQVAVKPLSQMEKAINQIAQGDADLTNHLEITTKDEIGTLAEGFNTFTKKMHTIVSELKSSKDDLSNYGQQLGAMVEDNTKFLTVMLNAIKGANSEISNQHSKVTSSVSAVDAISSSLASLRNFIDQQQQAITQASNAITKMIGSINSVSNSVETMAGEFETLQLDVEKGITQHHEVSKQIQAIEDQSMMLTEANEAISAIAEQTNLLAMNAAIEAAHAGDAGKGFAVVSDEIRKLSETSSTESKKISEQLRGILDAISTVVAASNTSDKSFMAVANKIKDTGNLVRSIRFAMDEQSKGSKQINDSLNYMHETSSLVTQASDAVDQSRQGIVSDITSLKQSSDSVKGEIETMNNNVKRMEEGDDSLLKISHSINGLITRIGNQVDKFKL